MATSTPTTPDHAPGELHPGIRRSFTVPAKLTDPTRPLPSIHPSESLEALYYHPAVKIVSFSVSVPATSSSRPNSSSGLRLAESASPQNTLIPWASPSERTLATAPLQISRVPPGVWFLTSGNFLRHIVAKSQMWCVDGISKFVLKVGTTSFYRIELPAESSDEKEKVEEFKCAVAKILQFEKTPSPFVTGQLHLADPITPARRKSLQPRDRAKKWRLNKVWEPEDAEHRARLRRSEMMVMDSNARRRDSHSEGVDESDGVASSNGSDEQDSGGGTNSISEAEVGLKRAEGQQDPNEEIPTEPAASVTTTKAILTARQVFSSRSVTAPVPLAVSRRELPAVTTSVNSRRKEADTISIDSSHESFHTVDESAKSPTETASFMTAEQFQQEPPPDDDIVEQFAAPKPLPSHSRCTSRTASTPNTPRPFRRPRTADGPEPSTPTLTSDSGDDGPEQPWAGVLTPPDSIRLRRLNRRMSGASLRPALDHLPHPANLLSPPRTPQRMSAGLIQKTYSILIGPPAHLVALMLRIAARIVQGLPVIYGPSGPHAPRQKMAGAWESSADEEDEWDEDDYGIPLGNLPRGSNASRSERLGSDWGVD